MRIELSAVTKRFGSARALDGVSFSIEPGKIVAVLGANGSGKTTLLRCLAGIVSPQQGSMLYDGKEFSRDDVEMRRRMFFMPDFPFLFWEMTALEHVGMCLKVYRIDQPGLPELTTELFRELDMLPLANSPLANLSRGQIYKAALSGLLAVDAELWLIDEPFASGMDPQGIAVFKRRAREAAARGATVIYTTQIVEIVERFSDLVCVLDHGEVKSFGSFDELRSRAPAEPALLGIFSSLRESP
jgi:ABC-type multidrug transport system ATPase subunit